MNLNISLEMLKGFIYSLFSPLLVSLFLGVFVGMEIAEGESWEQVFAACFRTFVLFFVVSLLLSSMFCLVIGMPVYILLRKLNWANAFTITLIGLIIAYLYSISDGRNTTLTSVVLMYGGASAFFFWFGSYKARKEAKA